METLDDPGFCVSCGAEVDGVEPDAREYKCESCGEHAVYGAEELLLMGEASDEWITLQERKLDYS